MSSSKDLISFHRFPDLPPELRRWVFHLSIEPRIVRVRWNSDIRHCTTPDNPAITQVSREARSEASKVLRLSFYTSLETRETIWFSHEIDTVSIDWYSFAKGEGAPGIITGQFPIHSEADNIKSLEVHSNELQYMGESMLQSGGYLKNLERLHVVGCQERDSRATPLSVGERFDMNSPGDKHWPELICDSNFDNRRCYIHYWFKEWNLTRSCQNKEWALVFSEIHQGAVRRYMSMIASRRFRERRKQKTNALGMRVNPTDGEGV